MTPNETVETSALMLSTSAILLSAMRTIRIMDGIAKHESIQTFIPERVIWNYGESDDSDLYAAVGKTVDGGTDLILNAGPIVKLLEDNQDDPVEAADILVRILIHELRHVHQTHTSLDGYLNRDAKEIDADGFTRCVMDETILTPETENESIFLRKCVMKAVDMLRPKLRKLYGHASRLSYVIDDTTVPLTVLPHASSREQTAAVMDEIFD